MEITSFLTSSGWNIVNTLQIPPRRGEVFRIDDLPISVASRDFLANSVPQGIYRHQKEAIQHSLAGNNICITTGAASGKSLPFYAAAIEQLINTPSSRIIAIYPLKALGREQEDRWKKALSNAGISAEVGRIDGQVLMSSRPAILRNSQVLILTPDIIHAWLLSNLSDQFVLNFLRCVSLIVVDEVHNYTGVFGSNAAFLFRRMQHIINLLGASPKYICASAMLGLDFTLIGPEFDTSPRHALEIQLVVPPRSADLLTEVFNTSSSFSKSNVSKIYRICR